ncbi:hypothetical protein CON26_16080 [Bacillus cereus]|nr:hypothetical protein CON26_16080 [Bacillus cereus]
MNKITHNEFYTNYNNLDHTNGAKAAVITSIANTAVIVLQRLLMSRWPAPLTNSEPIWRSNINGEDQRERLLRYDDRGPDIIFRDGFAPNSPIQSIGRYDWSLFEYVCAFMTEDRIPFVSTTRPEVNAEGQIIQWTPNVDENSEFVYEIFAPGGIDVNRSFGEGSPYPEQREITFPGGIRPEFIRSVRQQRLNEPENRWELVRIIINPNFIGEDDLPDIIIPEGTEVVQWNPQNASKHIKEDKIQKDNIDPMKRPGSLKPDPLKDDPKNPRRIPDGEYQIKSSIDQNVVINGSNGQSNLYAYQNNHKDEQIWRFEYNKYKKAYQIISVLSNYVIVANPPKSGTSLRPENQTGEDYGYWRVIQTDDGYYQLKNLADTSKVMDLRNSNIQNMTPIQLYDNNGTKAQKWSIDVVDTPLIPEGTYTISTKLNYKKVLDANDTNVMLYNSMNFHTQDWVFKYDVNKKAYKIYTKYFQNKGLFYQKENTNVSVDNIDIPDPDNLRPYWIIEYDLEQGGYLIRSLFNLTQVLHLQGSSTDDRTPILNYVVNFNKNQLWNIAPSQEKGK